MRFILFLTAFFVSLSSATSAIGLSVQECRDIKDVYGWAPDGCQNLTLVATKPQSQSMTKPAEVQATEPSAQQVEDHIFFPAGGTNLDPKALRQIELLTQLLNGEVLGKACIALIGHSDTSGGEVANMQVAQARADAVGVAMRQRLANPLKVEKVLAAGESLPLENLSPRSRWQRRVEIRARTCAVSM